MILKQIYLQNFRNYSKNTFSFSPKTTLVVGSNTSGKSNLIEAIIFLSNGKSSKTEKDMDAIKFGEELGRVRGIGQMAISEELNLEVVLTKGNVDSIQTPLKKFILNKLPKRRVDFAGNISAVSFSPSDLDVIIGSPGIRRELLDDTLESVDPLYRKASADYIKALRQRNALLDLAKKSGIRPEKQFEYWDNILIENGNYITSARENFIKFANSAKKDIFEFVMFYDKSEVSAARLEQYKNAEAASGVTLVGPHRDDFYVEFFNESDESAHNAKLFGSRGQQRLIILQLKILQMDFIEKSRGDRPIFLLDDIFSELDESHINLVLSEIGKQQTIITTTHEELVPKKLLKEMNVIKLGNK